MAPPSGGEKKKIQVKVFNIFRDDSRDERRERRWQQWKRKFTFQYVLMLLLSSYGFSKLFHPFRCNIHFTNIQQTFHKHHVPGILLSHENEDEETENQRNNMTVKYCMVNWDPDSRFLGGNHGHLCWNLKVCSGFVCGNAFLTCSLAA